MKNRYQTPEMILYPFACEDLITASDNWADDPFDEVIL